LRPGAGDAEIRDAYRRLAKIHHPDRNPDDPRALETFRLITESYSALRSRRPGTSTGRASGAAAGAPRRRTSPRRGSTSPGVTLADVPVGGALWVAAEALLVAPDRRAVLRPSAGGSAFPSAENVIRVERRADGLHVFMPPQPAARWPVSSAADTNGLAVAALWVGDRQDGDHGSAPAARVPLRLIHGTVGEMAAGDSGWTTREALDVDDEGGWTIDLAQPVSWEPHRSMQLRVLRDFDGFRVHSELGAAEWRPASNDVAGRAPVVAAILAGTEYARPAATEPGAR
jgi:hypothetical protein